MGVHEWAGHEVEQSLQREMSRAVYAPCSAQWYSAAVASARWQIWLRNCSFSRKTSMANAITVLCGRSGCRSYEVNATP